MTTAQQLKSANEITKAAGDLSRLSRLIGILSGEVLADLARPGKRST